MESLKEYKPRIIDKIKKFFYRIEKRKIIERNIEKLDLNSSSNANIDYIIRNEAKFKGATNMPEPQKEILSLEDKIGIVIDFFYDLDSDLGKKVEETYLKYKTQIYFDNCSDKNEEIGGGFTSGNNIVTRIMCGDGVERPNLIARICTNKNNALDIYNIAHEFTHILLNENRQANSNIDENQEIATRFIENLIGEYMEKRGIITTEDKENHNIGIRGVIQNAYQLDEYRVLRRLITNNGNKFDRKVETRYITEYCKGNKKWYNEILSNIAYRLPRKGKVDSFHNYLRFLDAAVECDRLIQAYSQNPDLVKKAFSQCLMSQHSITYNETEKKMNVIVYGENYRTRDSQKDFEQGDIFENER